MAEKKICNVVREGEDSARKEELEMVTARKNELFQANIELCEKNKIHRMKIAQLLKQSSKLEKLLREERAQREEIECDRVLFLNFIGELRSENQSLQVSVIHAL